jgi:elongation of very long chain fatty acids protein 6
MTLRESLADRLDCISVGTYVAFIVTSLVEQLPAVQSFSPHVNTLLALHTWSLPLVSILAYLIIVHWIAHRPHSTVFVWLQLHERHIKTLLKYWNLFLALLSMCMLLGMGIPLIEFVLKHGLEEAICDSQHRLWIGAAAFWVYVFAISKYAELLDTVFLILRKKPVTFLHWYHHASVLVYTWFAVVNGFTPGWYFAIINSAVHTLMYFYYYRMACGVRPTYDRFVTTFQLVQMVAGVLVTGMWAWLHYLPPNGEARCPNDMAGSVMLAAFTLYGSYFVLFLKLYLNRY